MSRMLILFLTFVQAFKLRLFGLVLAGLILAGVAPGAFVWAVAALFLVHLTTLQLLKFRAWSNHLPPTEEIRATARPGPDQPTDGETDEDPDETRDDPEPAPFQYDASQSAAERRDAVLKVFAWWIALPALLFGAWAWTEPVLGWYHTLQWPAAAIAGIGIILLGWPDRAFREQPAKRTAIRSAIAVAVAMVSAASLCLRHPYILPNYPDATKIRAERVLAAANIVTIQHHAGALVDYARELEQSAQIQKAGELLHLASRCDGTNPDIQEAFADFLLRHGRPGDDQAPRKLAANLRSGAALKVSGAPYDFGTTSPLPLFARQTAPGHAVVLVADRETPTALLDAVGSVLRTELGVPVFRHPRIVDIQTTTRRRGLTSQQVSVEEAWKEVTPQLDTQRTGPHQYLVVTARDLFAPGANFLYGSTTAPGQGIVSYARLGNPATSATNPALLDSLCKQALSTVLKSVIIYPSPDPRDVTAYVNGAFQLARKGRRPLPATLDAYHAQIRNWTEAPPQSQP